MYVGTLNETDLIFGKFDIKYKEPFYRDQPYTGVR